MVKSLILFTISLWVFLFAWTGVNGQIVEVELDQWSEMSKLNTPQQDKLYLHFDKPYYATGERMYFRAYLLDASSLIKDTLNNALYVELIDNREELVYRKKINRINGVFSGNFKLDEMLSEGSYWVRAYTNDMRNAGQGHFYKRPFFIGNNLSSEIRTSFDFNFLSKKKAVAEILFERKNTVMKMKEVSYRLNIPGKKPKRKKKAETTYKGILRYEYNPKKLYNERPSITVFYEDDINKYERTFLLPVKNEFDVQVFPEGGEVVLGTTNCIAFKAIKTNGLSIDVEGTLYDQEFKAISTFKSQHLGMGKFCFFADKFKRYHIIFTGPDREMQRVDLPIPKRKTFALGAVVKYGRILVHVKSEFACEVKDSLVLVGHMGGTIFYSDTISGTNPAVVFNIKDLHPGIAHFVLLDKNGDPISERLAFVRPEQTTQVLLDFSKPTHEKRRPVYCQLIAKDSNGDPIKNGSFSVSVTDAKAVELDFNADNMMSNLMLTSDIKGYIEKPGSYFNPTNKNAEENLDILLMTQGWRRFNTKRVLEGELKKVRFEIEEGLKIAGQVNAGSEKKPLADMQVLAYSPYTLYFNTTTTDSVGYFSFEHLRFPNGTQFSLEARSNTIDEKKVEFKLFPQQLPDIDYIIFPEGAATAIPNEYMQVTNEKYFNEHGTRNVYARSRGLMAITPGTIIEQSKNEQFSYASEEFVIEGAMLDRNKEHNFPKLLQSFPELENWYPELQPETNDEDNAFEEEIKGPRFAIDGIIYSYNEIKRTKPKELESIRILNNHPENNTKNWENILIALSFKKENPFSSSADKQHIASTMPLGYDDNVLFYEPKYNAFSERSNPIPDWRSTITFIPEIKTAANGKAVFSFFTADRMSPYNIEIEGISPQGEPCRYVTKKMLLHKDKAYMIGK